jgi:hypothetical protein
VAAAPALEAPVRSGLSLATFGLVCMSLLYATAAPAAKVVLVVGGLGGEAQFDQRFAAWSDQIARASATATGDRARVHRLAGEAARREAIEQKFAGFAAELRTGDEFVLVLLGHGSYDGNEYRLNIPGRDITGSEFAVLLDRLPATAPQLVVNATSASGAVAERWARPHRIVITATRSSGERNATRFGRYWAEALGSEEADRDKDGAITALEAYEFANHRVIDAFKTDAAIVTEHARISGSDPARFIVARLGDDAQFAGDPQLMALRGEQLAIEQRLVALRGQKAQLSEDDYYARLEPVLVEMARLGTRIDARLAVLGAGKGGDRATP